MADGTSASSLPSEPRFELIQDPNKDLEGTNATVLRAPSISQTDFPWVPPAAPAAAVVDSTTVSTTVGDVPAIDMAGLDKKADEAGDVRAAGDSPDKPKSKKKGTASAVKKPSKKPRSKGGKSAPKSKKEASSAAEAAGPVDGATTEEESDHGPYCICRGPDDHRWMICCEACEDWFHGECVNLDKFVGETLIEKFICPNCTDGKEYVTRYKRTCSLAGCLKPSRIYDTENESVFCSDEHSHAWWEQIISKLPSKTGKKSNQANDDRLMKEELMALLNSSLAGVDEKTGKWRLAKQPFVREGGDKQESTDAPQDVMAADQAAPVDFLRDEEKEILRASAKDRLMLGEEILQCKKMIQLLDWAHARLKAAISAGRLTPDTCGYDNRLDTVGVQAQFRAFAESDEGKKIFENQALGEPTGGMCEKKRCKPHAGWYNIFIRSTRAQIQELTATAQRKLDQEKFHREAAEERYYRLKAEKNSVEVIDSSGDEEDDDKKPCVDTDMTEAAAVGK